MTKTYKIGNTEINEYDINNLNHDYIKFKFDELLEALSDRKEECNNCPHDLTPTFTDKDLVTMPKQSTSLKEAVGNLILICDTNTTTTLGTERCADKIISLIQSHLLKEVEKEANDWVWRQDIIKIIKGLC